MNRKKCVWVYILFFFLSSDKLQALACFGYWKAFSKSIARCAPHFLSEKYAHTLSRLKSKISSLYWRLIWLTLSTNAPHAPSLGYSRQWLWRCINHARTHKLRNNNYMFDNRDSRRNFRKIFHTGIFICPAQWNSWFRTEIQEKILRQKRLHRQIADLKQRNEGIFCILILRNCNTVAEIIGDIHHTKNAVYIFGELNE